MWVHLYGMIGAYPALVPLLPGYLVVRCLGQPHTIRVALAGFRPRVFYTSAWFPRSAPAGGRVAETGPSAACRVNGPFPALRGGSAVSNIRRTATGETDR
jgi:hypothetical protein